MVPTDVENNNEYGFKVRFFFSGMVQPSFTDSLLSLPSIILFHFWIKTL